MKYLLMVYCTGAIMAALGLALAGAASVIATGIAVAVIVLAAGSAIALIVHVAGMARVNLELAKWQGRRAMLEAQQRQATIPRQLASPGITVDAVVLTQPAHVGYYSKD